MCNIWQQRKEHEITPLEIAKALSDDLFSEVTAIGLNGGEPTLRSDLHEVAGACINALPSLQSIALITNGLRPHLVIPAATKLYDIAKDNNVRLSIMISLDGVGDVHDAVRGRKGNFDAVQKCMQYFRDNSIGNSLSYGCTLIKENIPHAEKLMLLAVQQGIYCRFRVGIPHQRLYNNDNTGAFYLSRNETFHLCNFLDLLSSYYEKEDSRKVFLRNLRNQIAYKEPRTNGCAWQGEGVTLESNGNLSYCAVQSPTLGNLILDPSNASRFYYQSTKIRDNILETKCDTCLHDYDGRNFRNHTSDFNNLPPRKSIFTYSKKAIPPSFKPFARKIKSVLGFRFIDPIKHKRHIAVNTLEQFYLRRRNQVPPKTQNLLASCRILIVGWYGTETLGDKAILYEVLDGLKHAYAKPIAIDVASIEPYVTINTLYESGYADQVSVISLEKALQHAKDGLYAQAVFGGGPLMSSISYLQNISRIFTEVRALGGVCKLWGCGIGPIRDSYDDIPNKVAIGAILDSCSFSVCRDLPSAALANTYSPLSRCLGASLDPAYFWFRKMVVGFDKEKLPSSLSSAEDLKISNILFALRDLPLGEYYSSLSASDSALLQKSYNSAAKRLIGEAKSSCGSVYLQPMHRLACGGDDRLFYSQVLAKTGLEDLVNWQHEKPVDDVSRFMEADLCIVMRYHSLVLALAARKPVVPIDYTSGGKVGALCDALGIKCLSVGEFSALKISDLKNVATLPSSYRVKLEACEQESALAYESLVVDIREGS
jgi:sulfatase maturation enzyme AslB (radical SAM superfamily)/polysaccharide pyruvyl transferase WcaK-like protein